MTTQRLLSILAGVSAAAAVAAAEPAHAQFLKNEPRPPETEKAAPVQKAATPKAQPVAAKPAQAVKSAPTAAAAADPSGTDAQVQYLIRTTLVALSHANRTGNYTVLRDIASPTFRERNSAADLAAIFAELRRTRLDLSITAIRQPQLEGPPMVDADRRLRLKGLYATEPNRIVFDLLFEAVNGQWQIYGITISTAPARTAAR